MIPNYVAKNLSGIIEFNVERINKIESIVIHDIIAFLTYVAEKAGVDVRYLHYGMTSSDVFDTCLAVQLKESSDILLKNLKHLLAAFRRKVEGYKDIVCVGRSHGIHAEPTTLARFYAEYKRSYQRLGAQKEISTCKISGAVGNFANVDPFVEEYVAK